MDIRCISNSNWTWENLAILKTVTKFKITRFIPILIIIVAFICFFVFGLNKYFAFDAIKEHHNEIMVWTKNHFIIATISFCLIYTLIVTFTIPSATILSLIGGFLFGTVLGTIYIVFSATFGSVLIVLAIKTGIGDWLFQRKNKLIHALVQDFQKNPFCYLLFARLLPVFPFWMINIVSGFLNVRIPIFTIATLMGIIPGSFVYASLGSGLNTLFVKGGTPNLMIIFEPRILLPLIGLGILALIPIIYRKLHERSNGNGIC